MSRDPYSGQHHSDGPLFDRLPPHNSTDTSLAAAKSIRPIAGTVRALVFEALKERPLTNEELARSLNLRLQTVCGRVAELRDAGLVEDSGGRRVGESGRMHVTWRVKE